MWSVEDVTTREQRRRITRDKDSWKRSNCVIYSVEDVKKHGIGEIKKWKREEQRG